MNHKNERETKAAITVSHLRKWAPGRLPQKKGPGGQTSPPPHSQKCGALGLQKHPPPAPPPQLLVGCRVASWPPVPGGGSPSPSQKPSTRPPPPGTNGEGGSEGACLPRRAAAPASSAPWGSRTASAAGSQCARSTSATGPHPGGGVGSIVAMATMGTMRGSLRIKKQFGLLIIIVNPEFIEIFGAKEITKLQARGGGVVIAWSHKFI